MNEESQDKERRSALTGEDFESLLAWLDPDPDRAGGKYEKIYRRLIKIFEARGCPDADSLADETVDRVARGLPRIAANFGGDPALYFYGVAQHVQRERFRRKSPAPPPPPPAAPEETEEMSDCMERCLQNLSPPNRELILRYYTGEKQSKIDARKRLSEELGVGVNALRIRAHRIRSALQKCMDECLKARGG